MERTSPRQFEVTILGVRRPSLGEVFEIEIPPRRQRIEVECVDHEGAVALVERTNDGPAPHGPIQSRVISDRKVAPPDSRYGEKAHPHLTTKEMLASDEAGRNWEEFNPNEPDSSDWADEWEDLDSPSQPQEPECDFKDSDDF